MKRKIIIIISSLLFVSCEYSDSTHSQLLYVDRIDKQTTSPNYLNPLLEKVIANYIGEVDAYFIDKSWLYYNVFFFTDKGKEYFTMWTFTAFPHLQLSKDYHSIKYSTSLIKISNRKVVLIYPDESILNKLFFLSEQSIKDASIEANRPYEGYIYDGKWFFKTFEIFKGDKGLVIQKSESVNVSFFENKPPDSFLN